ncbi:MAG: hypothetical protein ACJA0S_001087 [Rickettsiales bacterium]|jgi:hypothetical protein
MATRIVIKDQDLVNGSIPAGLVERNRDLFGIEENEEYEIDLSYCTELSALPENLPDGITTLNLAGCDQLNALPENLPDGITTLNLSGCTELSALPENLPDGITTLNLAGCDQLTVESLRNLPSGITTLNLAGCDQLTVESLKNLPAGITALNLSYCTKLSALPENLPDGITTLNLAGCDQLTAESLRNLPSGITTLNLSDCTQLTAESLKNLPSGITTLNLSDCTQLTAESLKNLPSGITTLNLSDCTQLTAESLKNLPAGITTLDLSYCAQLTAESLKNLPAGITTLDLSGCAVPENPLPDSIVNNKNLISIQGSQALIDLGQENLQFARSVADQLTEASLKDLPILSSQLLSDLLPRIEAVKSILNKTEKGKNTFKVIQNFVFHQAFEILPEAISLVINNFLNPITKPTLSKEIIGTAIVKQKIQENKENKENKDMEFLVKMFSERKFLRIKADWDKIPENVSKRAIEKFLDLKPIQNNSNEQVNKKIKVEEGKEKDIKSNVLSGFDTREERVKFLKDNVIEGSQYDKYFKKNSEKEKNPSTTIEDPNIAAIASNFATTSRGGV